MKLWMKRFGLFPILAGVILVSPMLSACAKSERANSGRVPVTVHGVNHTDQEFSFVLADPLDQENRAGGETINAFGAGGGMCCFNLPKQWRTGLKAEIRATLWLPPTPTNNLPSVEKVYMLDVPAYELGKAPELWILRTGGDAFSLVASNLQPDHPQWPGAIKGWPVPSLEYQRVMHARYLKEAQSDVDLFRNLMAGLREKPVEHGKESWEFRRVNNASTLKRFKGPADPEFIDMLRAEYQIGLDEATEQLKKVRSAQP